MHHGVLCCLHYLTKVQEGKSGGFVLQKLLNRGCRHEDLFAGRLLNLRAFDKRDKLAAYSQQNGICSLCRKHFEFDEMEGDHIIPWSKGGQTTPDNCQMLCKSCNAKKTDKY
ncbi:MAG: HNH endonuclease [Candidatus Fournierella pullistercoris]|uniref:HNH endonuclease n=1 Tax=Candidatus Allofournierella pullistercoris TaxID=2838597 RepID=A0A948T3C0_9FIRM|nr:HNH endonuclease [Candidatus Fournierella pullistercoris]